MVPNTVVLLCYVRVWCTGPRTLLHKIADKVLVNIRVRIKVRDWGGLAISYYLFALLAILWYVYMHFYTRPALCPSK